MKKPFPGPLQIITGVYAVLYFIGFIGPLLWGSTSGDQPVSQVEFITVLIAFIVFLLGAVLAFFNEKYGGFILMLWHFLVWCFSMTCWPDAGMALVLAMPMLIVAVLLFAKGYGTEQNTILIPAGSGKLILQTLLVNYALIYFLIVILNALPRLGVTYISNVGELAAWDYTSVPGLILWLALALFILAFFVSWKRERVAGILLIIWYALIVSASFLSAQFADSGPWFIAGLVMLVQGIMYLVRKGQPSVSTEDLPLS